MNPIRAELIKFKSQQCPLLFVLLSLWRSGQHLSRLSTLRCLLTTSFHLDPCSLSQPHHTNCRRGRQDSSLSSDASKGTSKAWGYGYLCAHHFLKCMHHTRQSLREKAAGRWEIEGKDQDLHLRYENGGRHKPHHFPHLEPHSNSSQSHPGT